jgi:hypothetical protein
VLHSIIFHPINTHPDNVPMNETPNITISFRPTKIKLFCSKKDKSLVVAEGICINGSVNRIRPGVKALIHIRQSSSISIVADGIESLAAVLITDENPSLIDLLKRGCWVDANSFKQVVLKADANIERNRRGDRLIECTDLLAVLDHDKAYLPTRNGDEYNEFTRGNDNAIIPDEIHVKSQRHEIFAHWLIATYGKEYLSRGSGVIDVAGGNGTISKTLATLGIQSTLLDPNPRCHSDTEGKACIDLPFQVIPHPLNGDGSDLTSRADLISQTINNCSVICGLHPDQATEPIVALALRLNASFAIA